MHVVIQFHSKKEYNKFMRNYTAGKGTNLSHKNMTVVQDGGGFFDSLRSVGNTLKSVATSDAGKSLQKLALTAAVNGAQGALAQRGLSNNITNGLLNLGQNAGSKAIDGEGFFDDLKAGVKAVASSKIGKDLGNLAINQGANLARNALANRGYNGPLTNGLLDIGTQVASNQVNGGGFKKGSSEAKEKMARLRAMRGSKRGGSIMALA